ncbi:MAG: hypothetical protein R2764_21385 [Bacteroidales bacterium]
MKKTLILSLFYLTLLTAYCQDVTEKGEENNSAAQANNPLANMTALNFHNYYSSKLTDAPADAYINTSWIRFAKPFASGKVLIRLSQPISTIGTPDSVTGSVNAVNGLGDLNAFVSYNFISKPNATVGIGPNITMPTATEDLLGTGKWQGGFAFVAFVVQSPVLQLGGLITWQASFAGDEGRPETNVAAIQPFYFWQLGKGTYLRGAPIWIFDFENDTYSTPLALGIGKVVKVGSTMFNLFIEPQYSVLHKGTQPQFQVFTGINLQFINHN